MGGLFSKRLFYRQYSVKKLYEVSFQPARDYSTGVFFSKGLFILQTISKLYMAARGIIVQTKVFKLWGVSFSRTGLPLLIQTALQEDFWQGVKGHRVKGHTCRGKSTWWNCKEELEMDDSVRAARSLLENALSMMSPQSSSSSKLLNSRGKRVRESGWNFHWK